MVTFLHLDLDNFMMNHINYHILLLNSGVMVNGETGLVANLHRSIKKQVPPKHIFKKGKQGSGDGGECVKGLGGSVCSVGGLDIADRNCRALLKNYEMSNCAEKMAEATRMYIESIFQSQTLKDKLYRFFNKYVKGVDTLAKLIPDFLRADRQLMTEIEQELINAKDNIREVFPELLSESSRLAGEIDMFFVKRMMSFDFQLSDLEWNQSELPIGSGSFADVHIATLKNGKSKHQVALKLFKDAISQDTVSDILLEDRILRFVVLSLYKSLWR